MKHRERLERLQEQELAEAFRLHRRREDALNESLDNRDALLGLGRPSGAIDVAGLHAELAYLRRVDREILARRAAIQHSANDVEEERSELLGRRRDRKAIETLLDRRLEEERMQRNRAELRFVDELATTRWRRPEARH